MTATSDGQQDIIRWRRRCRASRVTTAGLRFGAGRGKSMSGALRILLINQDAMCATRPNYGRQCQVMRSRLDAIRCAYWQIRLHDLTRRSGANSSPSSSAGGIMMVMLIHAPRKGVNKAYMSIILRNGVVCAGRWRIAGAGHRLHAR